MTLLDAFGYFTEGRMTVELADNVSAVVALDKIKAKIQVRTRGSTSGSISQFHRHRDLRDVTPAPANGTKEMINPVSSRRLRPSPQRPPKR